MFLRGNTLKYGPGTDAATVGGDAVDPPAEPATAAPLLDEAAGGAGVGVGSAMADPIVRVKVARQAPAASSKRRGRIRVGIL